MSEVPVGTRKDTKQPLAREEEADFHENTDLEDSKWTTTRTELWAYYLYYVGNNGLSGFNFGPSQFQNLLYLAGYDPTQAPFTAACGDNGCVLPYLGKVRDSKRVFCFFGTAYRYVHS